MQRRRQPRVPEIDHLEERNTERNGGSPRSDHITVTGKPQKFLMREAIAEELGLVVQKTA
jgi:hypothetical protein